VRNFVKEHSLSLILGMILLTMLTFQFFAGYAEWSNEQNAHKEPLVFRDYLTHYASETVLSLEADVFGAIVLVLFTKWFFERGSAESN
jgi:hypothetical protein